MSSDQVLNVAVFGAGAFGRNHLRVYRQLEQSGFGVRLAAVAETDPVAAEMLRQQGTSLFFPRLNPAWRHAARENSTWTRSPSACLRPPIIPWPPRRWPRGSMSCWRNPSR